VNLNDLWEFRDLLITLASRDVRLRYRQTALGVLWVVLQPLIAAGIFAFVFGKVAGLAKDGDRIPYFAMTFAGMVAWMVFAGTLTKASGSLVQNSALVSKVFFPRLVLPLSTLFSTLVDLAVGLGMIALFMIVFSIPPTLALLTLPLWVGLLLLLALGAGLMASAVMVRYRDVAYIIPVLVSSLSFASPSGWPLAKMKENIPDALQGLYYALNPVAVAVEGMRWSLYGQGEIPWAWVAYSGTVAVLGLVAGLVVFRQQERGFADVI
jgi:lipopolysaccharide transport system permease protein